MEQQYRPNEVFKGTLGDTRYMLCSFFFLFCMLCKCSSPTLFIEYMVREREMASEIDPAACNMISAALIDLVEYRMNVDGSVGYTKVSLSYKSDFEGRVAFRQPNGTYLGDKRKLFRIMDTKLGEKYPPKGAHMAANLASQCLNGEAKVRPRMSEVLATLEQIEAPKGSARNSHSELRAVQIPVRQSPLRNNHSPLALTLSASPLPSHRQSPRVL